MTMKTRVWLLLQTHPSYYKLFQRSWMTDDPKSSTTKNQAFFYVCPTCEFLLPMCPIWKIKYQYVLDEILKHEYTKSNGELEGDVATSLPIEMTDSWWPFSLFFEMTDSWTHLKLEWLSSTLTKLSRNVYFFCPQNYQPQGGKAKGNFQGRLACRVVWLWKISSFP